MSLPQSWPLLHSFTMNETTWKEKKELTISFKYPSPIKYSHKNFQCPTASTICISCGDHMSNIRVPRLCHSGSTQVRKLNQHILHNMKSNEMRHMDSLFRKQDSENIPKLESYVLLSYVFDTETIRSDTSYNKEYTWGRSMYAITSNLLICRKGWSTEYPIFCSRRRCCPKV